MRVTQLLFFSISRLAKVAFGGDREQRAVQVGEVEEKLGMDKLWSRFHEDVHLPALTHHFSIIL